MVPQDAVGDIKLMDSSFGQDKLALKEKDSGILGLLNNLSVLVVGIFLIIHRSST